MNSLAILSNLAQEAAFLPPSVKQTLCEVIIPTFVNTSPLFAALENKPFAIASLTRVAMKQDFYQRLDELSEAINTFPMNWNHPIFQDPDLHDYLVLALIEKKIECCALATILTRQACIQRYDHPNVQTILKGKQPYFQDLELFHRTGKRNQVAEELLQQSLTSNSKPSYQLSLQEFREWYDLMTNKPASEQTFSLQQIFSTSYENLLLFSRARKDIGDDAYLKMMMFEASLNAFERPDILDGALIRENFNIFYRVVYRGEVYEICPSFSMILAYIEIIGKRDLLPNRYEFQLGSGPSPWSQEGKLVIPLQSKFASLPDEIDLYYAPPHKYTLYHALFQHRRFLHVPESIQRMLIVYAGAMQTKMQQLSFHPPGLTSNQLLLYQRIQQKILNLSTTLFDPNENQHLRNADNRQYNAVAFWHHLQDCITNGYNDFFTLKARELVKMPEPQLDPLSSLEAIIKANDLTMMHEDDAHLQVHKYALQTLFSPPYFHLLNANAQEFLTQLLISGEHYNSQYLQDPHSNKQGFPPLTTLAKTFLPAPQVI